MKSLRTTPGGPTVLGARIVLLIAHGGVHHTVELAKQLNFPADDLTTLLEDLKRVGVLTYAPDTGWNITGTPNGATT